MTSRLKIAESIYCSSLPRFQSLQHLVLKSPSESHDATRYGASQWAPDYKEEAERKSVGGSVDEAYAAEWNLHQARQVEESGSIKMFQISV